MPFNPYHQWLGLKVELDNPNYFQLLGIGTKVDDESNYQAKVKESVRVRLEKLSRIDPGAHQAILEQLQQRVRRAGATLIHPQKRAEYLEKLKTAKNASIKVNAAMVASAVQKSPSKPSPEFPSPPVLREPNQPNEPNQPAESSELGSEVISVPQLADGSAKSTKPKKNKLPLSIWICTALICIASIAGPLLVANVVLNRPPVASSDPQPAVTPKPDEKQNTFNGVRGGAVESLADVATKTDQTTQATAEGDRNPADAKPKFVNRRLFNKPRQPDTTNPQTRNRLDRVASNQVGFGSPNNAEPVAKLSALQLHGLQRLARRIQAAFSRRDSEVVVLLHEFENQLNAVKDNAELAPAFELLKSYKFIELQLRGFWTTVRQGYGRALPSDFAVNGVPHKVHEYSNDYIDFQLPRGRVKHFYNFMPPSVAIAGSKNHAFVDTTANRLYLAAFIATQSGHVRETYNDELNKLMLLLPAESELIKVYIEESFATQAPSLMGAMPKTKDLDQLIEEFLVKQGITNSKKLTQSEAIRYSRQFLLLKPASVDEAIVAVEAARRLAVEGGDAFLLADAIVELGYLSDADPAKLCCDSFTDLSSKKLPIEQVQRSLEIIYPLTETADKNMVSRFKRLKSKWKAISVSYGLFGYAQLSELD